jgi:hypothetical protein
MACHIDATQDAPDRKGVEHQEPHQYETQDTGGGQVAGI